MKGANTLMLTGYGKSSYKVPEKLKVDHTLLHSTQERVTILLPFFIRGHVDRHKALSLLGQIAEGHGQNEYLGL